MRNAFAEEITELAKENSDIILLSGDIGNRLFDYYKEIAPERFLNCGVAEQNMISMAAGMALCGLKPIVYTITSFITTRCFEQIKIDLCYHNLPVIIVGVGSGLCYAECGPTHHSCEDIGILRTLPNLAIICPGDAYEVKAALRAALKNPGPTYIRLGKKGEPLIHQKIPEFKIGKAITIKEGKKVCLLSTGNTLPLAIRAAEELKQKGLSPRVVSSHTIKPLDEETLEEIFSQFKIVLTIEEHSLIGGLGSSLAEWSVRQKGKKAKLICLGIPDSFLDRAGDQDYARQRFDLTSQTIVNKVLKSLNNE